MDSHWNVFSVFFLLFLNKKNEYMHNITYSVPRKRSCEAYTYITRKGDRDVNPTSLNLLLINLVPCSVVPVHLTCS